MGFRNTILAGIELVREAIRSPDYNGNGTGTPPATLGWYLGRNGLAELAQVFLRGNLTLPASTAVFPTFDPQAAVRWVDENGNVVAWLAGYDNPNAALLIRAVEFVTIDKPGGASLTVRDQVLSSDMIISGDLEVTGSITHNSPRCRLTRSTPFTVADDGAEHTIPFDTELYDPRAMHSGGLSAARITIPETGSYHVGAGVRFDSNAAGRRFLGIDRVSAGGATTERIAGDNKPAVAGGFTTFCTASTDIDAQAGDYLLAKVIQNSGGNLDVRASAAGELLPAFWAHRIA